jgi:transposase InsO family protein
MCKVCQKYKNPNRRILGEIQPLTVPDGPGLEYGLDLVNGIGEKSEGVMYLIVLVDRFSKYVNIYKCKHMPNTEEIWDSIKGEVTRKGKENRGLIVTKPASVFCSERWKELLEENNIERRLTSAYHPGSDRLAERTIQTLVRVLQRQRKGRQWPKGLEQAKEAINNSIAAHNINPETIERTRGCSGTEAKKLYEIVK